MGWYSHPDTMSIAAAHHRAKEASGETGTLKYLRAYRDEYQEEVRNNPMSGGAEYISSLDAAIEEWEQGDFPDFSELACPGMLGVRSSPKL